MNASKPRTNGIRKLTLAMAIVVFGATLAPHAARAAERKFMVMLANSPKQYPGPSRDPLGQPTGGLINRKTIGDQYFDKLKPEIGSFAEYWEEISYGDVTVAGIPTDWVSIPWPIQPMLVNVNADGPTGPPTEEIGNDDPARMTPSLYHENNASGQYEYGASEPFDTGTARIILDFNGDPEGEDDGPFVPGPGGMDVTPNARNDVYMPGERFLDIDGDGKWDALDEANNCIDMDENLRPDGRGPWVDLNGDNQGQTEEDCSCRDPDGGCYLDDSDNDSDFHIRPPRDTPDCCPAGPGPAASRSPMSTPARPRDGPIATATRSSTATET